MTMGEWETEVVQIRFGLSEKRFVFAQNVGNFWIYFLFFLRNQDNIGNYCGWFSINKLNTFRITSDERQQWWWWCWRRRCRAHYQKPITHRKIVFCLVEHTAASHITNNIYARHSILIGYHKQKWIHHWFNMLFIFLFVRWVHILACRMFPIKITRYWIVDISSSI